MLMQKIMHYPMYLFAIMIILINYYVRNDSTYTSRSKRNKLWVWMRKHVSMITSKIDNALLSIEEYFMKEREYNCKKKKSRVRNRKMILSIAYAATAMNAELDKRTNVIPFDSDSAPIGVDNRCTACISHIVEDFIGNLVDSKRTIKGFGGSRTAGIKMGTQNAIEWIH